ncbi:MAG: hypothetical protein UY67_C0001G0059 [Candidatus Kaiserbacteria bacterium GW2011_GWA2_52_12]|uniref:Peptidase M15A C-terminal domain-containing protein n=1 Tax=Candidatus Kaiserbacteria bacterium GW2011_GWA2_52_12 TaxID=1618671 RepID=A0A0G1ZBD8_9BACT|nr:MAG: hypothetical protein UY67_C0001G0059 [Candidatus Kaiserbacteria bacterium GW2011_GWA2_52_12]
MVSMRHVVGLLLGALITIYATSADAKRSEEVKQRDEIERIAEEQKKYEECVLETQIIAGTYFADQTARSGRTSDIDEYLFLIYLRTTKFDGKCFAHKDPQAAERRKMTLPQYTIGGVHPVFKERLVRLCKKLETEGFLCGITSPFRDDYRQKISEGFRAGNCNSYHGGSCRTKGWGDGRAVDMVNISSITATKKERVANNIKLWARIDELEKEFLIYRPMPDRDPMHIQPRGTLEAVAGLREEMQKSVEVEKRKEDVSGHGKKKRHIKKKTKKR